MRYDALIVGGGIAGMESGIVLADMGYKVLLVEKQASIGGKMILLSKVFPTLDCASCIATPKMAAVANHENITVLPFSEVDEIERREDGSFRVRLHRNPTFVDPAKCTGCGECELACTVAVPDQFNSNLVARRAAHIAFPQAVPKKALIDRHGSSPCSAACPAGVKAHGFVSLVRAGKHEEAFHLHMEDAPLPGSLSRACYAPCEDACTRSELEAPVSIRQIKRFMTDRYYEEHPVPEYGPPTTLEDKKVAIVGSGPAGLSAAYHLARRGYPVTIFEAADKPGGMLRYAIPAYRLPKDVLDRDIANITALGVEIRTSTKVSSVHTLKEQGFDSAFVAVGTSETWRMGIPGEDLDGVMDCMSFLRRANSGDFDTLAGQTVVVIGGGNSAIDPARMALRLGATRVLIMYRRSRAEMPAHDWEVQGALDEGVELDVLKTPKRFLGEGGTLRRLEYLDMRLCEVDDSGRRRPTPIDGSETTITADLVVLSIGLRPDTEPFSKELKENRNETLAVDDVTLATSAPGVFAGGDAVTGPLSIVNAIGQGKQAAFYMDRFMHGESLEGAVLDDRLPAVEPASVIARGAVSARPRLRAPELALAQRIPGQPEIEGCLSEDQARASANRCLDCGGCSECGECLKACPADAIDFDMRRQNREIEVGSVVLSTGFELFNPSCKPMYGYGRLPNVVDAMQMDRILAPTRPYNAVIRPSDGMAPSNIAFVLCTGSRDQTIGNRYCSQVCCMYSAKQAQLLMGALPLADITIYYIDIRAFGKGYEEFAEQTREMGVYFVKGRVGRIEETEEQNLVLHYEDICGEGGMQQAEHDMVVLSVGLLPNPEALSMFSNATLESDTMPFVREINPSLEPGRTSVDGVFVSGAASGPRDIPDTIVHSGAAAAQAAAYLTSMRAEK